MRIAICDDNPQDLQLAMTRVREYDPSGQVTAFPTALPL